MRVFLVAAAPAVLALGCSSDDNFQLRLDVPFGARARSAIIVYTAGERTTATAIELDANGVFVPLIEPHVEGDGAEVHVLAFGAPLADLALTPGVLVLDAARGRPLPDPIAVHRATIQSTNVNDWITTDAPGAALDALRIVAPVPCPSFTETELALDTTSSIRFVMPAPGGGAIAQTEAGELFYAERSAATRMAGPLGTDGSPLPFFSGYLEENGSIWLGGDIGGVWNGNLTPPGCDAAANPCRIEVEEGSIVTNSDEVLRLAGPARGPATILFAMTERGSLERFDGSMWTRLYDFADTPGFYFQGDVAYLGPDEAAAGDEFTETVIRYRDGEIAASALPGPPSGVTALAHQPGLGVIAGEKSGAVSIGRIHGTLWTALAGTSTHAVTAIQPYAGGFAWVDAAGRLRTYSPSGGVCPDAVAARQVQGLAASGEALVVAGRRTLRWLTPR